MATERGVQPQPSRPVDEGRHAGRGHDMLLELLAEEAPAKVVRPLFIVRLHRLRSTVERAAIYFLLFNGAFVFLYPILWMISVSLMTPLDYVDESIRWVPVNFVWRNFVDVLEPMRFWTSLRNSAWIAFPAMVGQLLSSALVGYGFARLRFAGRDFLFALVLLSLVIPPQTILIPRYILYRILGWIDTVNPFVVPSFFGFGLYGALFIFIFRQVFSQFPYELDEAAKIDGAGIFATFYRIFLPLAKPAAITVVLFSFVWNWNDYAGQSIFLNRLRTLPLALSQFTATPDMLEAGGAAAAYPFLMAATFLSMLPCMVLYLLTQRYFIQGIESIGVKG